VSRNQDSAKRADRAVLELAKILSDGEWHTTSYLAIAAGKYLRPEVAWRRAPGNLSEGQRLYVNRKLCVWKRFGRVEKRRNGKRMEWRLLKTDWVDAYLAELDKRRAGSRQRDAHNMVGPRRYVLTGIRVTCPNCQYSFAVKSASGRKPLNIPFINICEALQHYRDVRLAADSLGCSVGYIYKVLGQQGKRPKDVIPAPLAIGLRR